MERQGLVSTASSVQNGWMTITYTDGTSVHAIFLSRQDQTLKVAAQRAEDTQTFSLVDESWISESGDAVKIEFEWQRRRQSIPRLDQRVCSKVLASRLIASLFYPEADVVTPKDLCGAPPVLAMAANAVAGSVS